jgi:hypothetical protein
MCASAMPEISEMKLTFKPFLKLFTMATTFHFSETCSKPFLMPLIIS